VKEQMRRIFGKFDEYRTVWETATQCVSELDALMSMTMWSVTGDGDGPMCRPEFVEPTEGVEPFLHLHNARHPAIAGSVSSGSFIPNDTFLGKDAEASGTAAAVTAPCVLITGPNMGGKSTMLRQTCCCVLLAQMVRRPWRSRVVACSPLCDVSPCFPFFFLFRAWNPSRDASCRRHKLV